jgi:hypothetical protein
MRTRHNFRNNPRIYVPFVYEKLTTMKVLIARIGRVYDVTCTFCASRRC